MPEGWTVDGVGLRNGPVSSGDFTVALEGTDAVGMLLPAGLFTHAISPRLNGAVRSPFLEPTSPRVVSLEMNGGDYSTRRLVVDNGFLTEREWGYMEDDELHWVCHTQNAADKSAWPKSAVEAAETRNYLEFTTKTSNPYFPPRYGLGGMQRGRNREGRLRVAGPEELVRRHPGVLGQQRQGHELRGHLRLRRIAGGRAVPVPTSLSPVILHPACRKPQPGMAGG